MTETIEYNLIMMVMTILGAGSPMIIIRDYARAMATEVTDCLRTSRKSGRLLLWMRLGTAATIGSLCKRAVLIARRGLRELADTQPPALWCRGATKAVDEALLSTKSVGQFSTLESPNKRSHFSNNASLQIAVETPACAHRSGALTTGFPASTDALVLRTAACSLRSGALRNETSSLIYSAGACALRSGALTNRSRALSDRSPACAVRSGDLTDKL